MVNLFLVTKLGTIEDQTLQQQTPDRPFTRTAASEIGQANVSINSQMETRLKEVVATVAHNER